MKRILTTAGLLIVFQIVTLLGGIWVSVNLHSTCSFVPNQTATWQCTTNTDPTLIPTIAFVVLPPLLTAYAYWLFRRAVPWKRTIILHVITAIIVWWILWYVSTPHCGCGGA